jgi:hypothetical protein
MKTKTLAMLLAVFLCVGCKHVGEIRPGIYIASDPATLPLPTSGYRLFVVGETHGNQETKQVLLAYLKQLHQSSDLRDIILEEDQAYEPDANTYVQGISNKLPEGLCLRTDVLDGLREYNASLPQNEKIIVHLVDLDSPLSLLYAHLQRLWAEIGPSAASIQIPAYDTFIYWPGKQSFTLIDQLSKLAKNNADVLNGLETVRYSLQFYYLGSVIDSDQGYGTSADVPIREDVITTNVQYLLKKLNDKPVMAFFGAGHTVKTQQAFPANAIGAKVSPWGPRIADLGIKVFSLAVEGLSGSTFWRGQAYSVGQGMDKIQFADGTSLASLLGAAQNQSFLYADLGVAENATIHAIPGFNDIPAQQIYDGLILSKQFTPMENICP